MKVLHSDALTSGLLEFAEMVESEDPNPDFGYQFLHQLDERGDPKLYSRFDEVLLRITRMSVGLSESSFGRNDIAAEIRSIVRALDTP